MGIKKTITVLLTVFIICFAFGQKIWPAPGSSAGLPFIGITGQIDWEKGGLSFTAVFDLAAAGIRFPAGRGQAEEILNEEYPGLVRSLLFSIQADSSSTIGDLVEKGELSLRELDEICLNAKKIPPNFSADLTKFLGSYLIDTSRISQALIHHNQAADPVRPVIPTPAANYTGIIIVADSPLPIHGRNTGAFLVPCIFPKIWDTDMNLIYDKKMTDPLITGSGVKNTVYYTGVKNIYHPTPSGLDSDLTALVGEHPLRIFAGGVFGMVPTDPVIDKADALLILSNENNRRLLKEGKVVIAINENQITENR